MPREGAIDFLEFLSEYFEVIMYSSRKPSIVKSIAKELDPQKKIFRQLLDRSNCILTGGKKFIKDLRLIKNRSSKNVVFIDYKP